jgi:hypothetical protein
MAIRIGTEVTATIEVESTAIAITVTGAGTIIKSHPQLSGLLQKGIAYLTNVKVVHIIGVGATIQQMLASRRGFLQ